MSLNPNLYTILSETPEPTQVTAQYVWGARPGHRDELILRDRDSGGGSLDERLYCLMDYFDPTTVIDPTGAVVERYGWSAFGQQRVIDADWEPLASSAVAFDCGFHGQFLDGETGYYNYGYRYYSPEIGRWLSRDPIGERGGENLYLFVNNGPLGLIDKLGLIVQSAGIVSWIAPFDSVVQYQSLDLSRIENPVFLPFLRAGVEGLARTANTTPPPVLIDSASAINWNQTRGGLLVEFDFSCCGDNPSISVNSISESPGFTPDPITGGFHAAQGISARQEYLDWKGLGFKGRKSVTVYNHARVGGLGAWVGRLSSNHGIPYIGRSVSVTLDCVLKSYFFTYGGSEFPSHAAYVGEPGAEGFLKIASHIQANLELLLFGMEGEILPIETFHVSDSFRYSD